MIRTIITIIMTLFLSILCHGRSVTLTSHQDDESPKGGSPKKVDRIVEYTSNGIDVTYLISEISLTPDASELGSNILSIDMFSDTQIDSTSTTLSRTDFIFIPKGYTARVALVEQEYREIDNNISTPKIQSWEDGAITSPGFHSYSDVISKGNIDDYRSHKIIPIHIYPTQRFDPKVRIFTKIKYRVSFTQMANPDNYVNLKLSNDSYSKLRQLILNKKTLEEDSVNYPCSEKSGYLIISHPKYNEAIHLLAYNKSISGFNVHVSTSDSWNPQSIKDSIRAHALKDPMLEYLCIIGDNDDVPSEMDYQNPIDYNYTLLSNENSFFADLYFGRICVSTPTQATNVVKKLTDYEFSPPNESSFYSTVAIGAQFDNYPKEGVPTNTDPFGFATCMEQISSHLENKGRAVKRFYWSKELSDPKFWSDGEPIPEELTKDTFKWNADSAQFKSIIDNGTAFFMTFAHGGRHGWAAPKVFTMDIFDLDNKKLLPFMINISCSTGNFSKINSEPCMAEALLGLSSGGASGVIAATGSIKVETGEKLAFAFTNNIFGTPYLTDRISGIQYGANNSCRMGQILDNSIDSWYEYTDLNTKTSFNVLPDRKQIILFGDPALNLWIQRPRPIMPPNTVSSGDKYGFSKPNIVGVKMTLIDYYSGAQIVTDDFSQLYKTKTPEFVECCFSAPSYRYYKTMLKPNTNSLIINKSTFDRVSKTCTSTLIGNALPYCNSTPIVISTDQFNVTTKSVTILPNVEIKENANINIIIE